MLHLTDVNMIKTSTWYLGFIFHPFCMRVSSLPIDGPALRATALMSYAGWLIDNTNTTFVNSNIWPILKLDLDYTANYWNQSTYDLWEEVHSSSFFTTAVQHRALRTGAALASKLGQTSVASVYSTQADNVLCFLQVRFA